MTPSRKGVFARNITSNLAGYLVSAVVALYLSPFVINTLGALNAGVWALLVSLTGYYGLLDLGVRSAVGQYVTRYDSKGDIDGVNRTFSTSMTLLLAVAVLGLAVTLALLPFVPGFLEAKNLTARQAGGVPGVDWLTDPQLAAQIADTRLALLIAGSGVALGIPMSVWATATYARERFDISNAIGIGERLLLAGATIVVLNQGSGIVGVAAVTVGTQLLASTARMVIAYRLMPGLQLSLLRCARESVRELTSYGIYNFMVNAADRIVQYMDLIVVSAFLGLSDVTTYNIGALLIPYYMSLILAITWTMTPYATACDARQDTDALRRLLLQGTRGSLFVAAVIGSGLVLAGDEFLPLWQKEEFLAGDTGYHVLVILAWSTLARASTSCGRQILFGIRRMKLLAGMAFAEAGLNIGLSLLLVQHYGLPGVAVGTLVSVVLVYVVAQNLYVVRLTGASGLAYLAQIARATVPVMGGMYLVSLWADSWLVVDGWGWFAVQVALLLVPVWPIAYLVVMTRDERDMVKRRLGLRR